MEDSTVKMEFTKGELQDILMATNFRYADCDVKSKKAEEEGEEEGAKIYRIIRDRYALIAQKISDSLKSLNQGVRR